MRRTEAEAGAAAARRGRGAARGCPTATSSSSTSSARSRRARSWRSTRSASRASISSPTEERHYPMGRVAAQVLGGVDVDEHGVAGVEKSFDQRLCSDRTPLRLSLDVRVQAVVRDELSKAMDEFQAIGACGIVMDVNTGEVLAMVSLPDYDANDFRDRAGGRPVQPRRHRHVRAGQHVQAADRVDGAGWRHRAHLGRVRRLAPDPYRPLHHHRLRGQAPLAVSAGGARLLLQPRRRAYRRGRSGARAPARLAEEDGHVRPRRHRAAGGRRCRSCSRRRLEGGRRR